MLILLFDCLFLFGSSVWLILSLFDSSILFFLSLLILLIYCFSPFWLFCLVAPLYYMHFCFSLPVLLFGSFIWYGLTWLFCLDSFSLLMVDGDGSCCSFCDDNSLRLLLSIDYAMSWFGLFSGLICNKLKTW